MSIYNSFLAPCKWLSGILAKGTALFVILTAVITFFVPGAFKWVEGTTQTIILGVIMLSMGLTLGKQDFVILAKRPFDIFVGAIGQFTIMPFLAWIITRIFNLPSDLAVGLILVGCVPGGVSSNIMSFLCHGDLAFSVGMTTASTLIAPVMTPLLIGYLCSGQHVDVDPMGMIMFLLYVTIIPVALGAFLNMTMNKRKSFADIKACMPGVSVIGLACIVGGVVAHHGDKFVSMGLLAFCCIFFHNALGYCLGYVLGIIFRFNTAKKRTISIEVGVQNAGLGTGLAAKFFPQLPGAAVATAVACVWHSISGTILANLYALSDKNGAPADSAAPVEGKPAEENMSEEKPLNA